MSSNLHASETLRAKFADSNHLVRSDEKRGYITITDTSGKAISGVLLQESKDGHYNKLSEASSVLSAAESCYTCDESYLRQFTH